jgi:hypothetical protein
VLVKRKQKREERREEMVRARAEKRGPCQRGKIWQAVLTALICLNVKTKKKEERSEIRYLVVESKQ